MTKLDDRTEALSRLMARIFEHEQHGEVVPCVDPRVGHRWVSDDPELQEAAAHACRSCPALTACDLYVDAYPETAGTWAGQTEADRAPERRRRIPERAMTP